MQTINVGRRAWKLAVVARAAAVPAGRIRRAGNLPAVSVVPWSPSRCPTTFLLPLSLHTAFTLAWIFESRGMSDAS